MLPVSWGVDNKAVASVLGGIGDARAKIRAQMGAEPGSVPHLSNLEDIRKSVLKAIYMPLQLDHADLDGEGSRRSSRSMINQAKRISPSNPLVDPGIWNVAGEGDNVRRIVVPSGKPKTKLYTYANGTRNPAREEAAIIFTTALMQVSLSSVEMYGKYSHLLDVERAHLKDRKFFPMRNEYDAEGEDFCKVMMCTFEISPKDKNSHISGDVWDEIEAMRDAGRNKKPPAPKTETEPAKTEATPPTK